MAGALFFPSNRARPGVVGVYGIVSYVVALQTRETGIRLALGQQPAAVVRMFVSRSLILVAVGAVIGLGVAAAATRSMAFLLFGIRQVDPVTYVAVPGVLALAALLASYLPARRAGTLDPAHGICQRCRGASCPPPAAAKTLPFSYTTSPRRIVTIGQPVNSQPAKIENFAFASGRDDEAVANHMIDDWLLDRRRHDQRHQRRQHDR